MGSKAKWEYFRVVYERYRKSERAGKKVMLDEFCRNTGYNRKYAIRLLNGAPPGKERGPARRARRVSYGHQALSILAAVWEAAGYPWSVRLKALLPDWLPWIRQHYRPSAAVEKQLLGISARQIDRRLRAKKQAQRRRIYGRTKPGCLLKHQIPVKTDSWDVKTPGLAEIDLVSHSGNSGAGDFAQSLNLTNIYTGWTESRALLGKSQVAVQQALEEIRSRLPFRLLGLDSDNGSEFINWHLRHWCEENQIQLTRGRPYKKDDNAHVEQKNWTHVRKLLGWERYDSPTAVTAINDLYRQELRLWLNLYLPSVKLVKKVRVGSKVRRVYDAAQTPLQRILASGRGDTKRVAELKKLRLSMDPFRLGQQIDEKLQRIYPMANQRLSPKPDQANGEARTRENPQPRHRQNGKRKSNEKTYHPELRNKGWGKRASNAGPLPPGPLAPAHGYISNVSTT
ncbi:MAG TPA: transposase family protein [Terriglobales bacterium]|nr:transposase family protein [Terriglobales bacterium]